MSICVTFLGTGAAIPTADRSLPAVLLTRNGEQIMFDCGEGVQRQMIKAKSGLHKPLKIFITHMHGDHVLGLPGLLQTMSLMDRQKPVELYAPQGIAHFLECLRETLQFQLTFQVNIHEIANPGIICEEEQYYVEAEHTNHAITSFAYAFIEKPRPGRFNIQKAIELGIPEGAAWGKLQRGEKYVLPNGQVVNPSVVSGPLRSGRKIIYTGDTKPFERFTQFAQNADLVIHEATFDDALAEKAAMDGHSTPSQAATQAKIANAKSLVLTHISARYSDVTLLLTQARKVFENTQVASDFLELILPLSE
jgi:ribonuclease Z